tara:strand:- start:491 stop:697 length:207 start_codon:yes stop_codon:yes gene_type:complete
MATAILEGVAEREAVLQENEEPQNIEDSDLSDEDLVMSSLETAPLEELAEMMHQAPQDDDPGNISDVN